MSRVHSFIYDGKEVPSCCYIHISESILLLHELSWVRQQLDKRLQISLANGRDIELVFRIVWINEIVGNPVCQHEIPKEIASAKGVI